VDHGGLFVGPCGPELVEGVLEVVGFEGLAVGLAEHLHLVLEAGSHGSSGDSSRGGCGGVVGGWCPGWGRGEASKFFHSVLLSIVWPAERRHNINTIHIELFSGLPCELITTMS